MLFARNIGIAILLMAFISPGSVYAQTKPDKTGADLGKYKGLQISRAELVTTLSSTDSLFNFKEVPNTKGLPKLTAKGIYGARVEVTGTEDNVTKVQWAVGQPAVGTLSKLAFTRMAFFVNVLAKTEGAAWFFQQANAYNSMPTTPLNNISYINGVKLVFDYSSAKKVFTVTISAE